MIHATRLLDIFTGERREWLCHPGCALRDYAPSGWDARRGVVELDGRRVSDLSIVPRDGASVVWVDLPMGLEPGTWITIIAFVLLTAASVVTSILLRPRPPSLNTGRGKEDEVPPIFAGPQTRVGAGQKLPVVVGRVRAGGHIVESFLKPHFEEDGAADSADGGTQEVSTTFSGRETLHTRVVWSWGPVQSVTAFELDSNPIANIVGVMHQTKRGVGDDAPLVGFSETPLPQGQSAFGEITETGNPEERQTQNVVRTVEIAVEFTQGLFRVNNKGKLRNREVQVEFAYRRAGTVPYTIWKTVTFSAKSRSRLRKWVRFPQLDPDVYDFRVDRITADNTNPKIQDKFVWAEMNEVIGGARAHPGVSETGFRQIAQEQARSPRNYTALIEGLSDVRVYTTPTTFSRQFTRNPAWLFMRLVTDDFFGFGKFFTYSSFDIQDFIDLAAHCDETVSNGAGGQQKRCFIDAEFFSDNTLEDLVETFSNASDARIYLNGDKWHVDINKNKVEEIVFTEGAYTDASLEVRYLDKRPRSSRIVAKYRDEDNEYNEGAFTQVDQQALEQQIHVTTDLTTPGIVRTAQIGRFLQKVVNFNRISDETVSLQVGLGAIDMRLGSVFGVESASTGSVVASGRLHELSADLTRLRLDAQVTLDPAKQYSITVQFTDRTLHKRAILGVTANPTDWVRVADGAWTGDPVAGDEYFLAETATVRTLYRVEDISLEEDLTRRIVGSKYDNAINVTDVRVEAQKRTRLPSPDKIPPAITGLNLVEDTDTGNFLLSWNCPQGLVRDHEVWLREQGDRNWIFLKRTEDCATDIEVDELENGTTYELTVRSTSPRGQKLSLDLTPVVTLQKSTPP